MCHLIARKVLRTRLKVCCEENVTLDIFNYLSLISIVFDKIADFCRLPLSNEDLNFKYYANVSYPSTTVVGIISIQ